MTEMQARKSDWSGSVGYRDDRDMPLGCAIALLAFTLVWTCVLVAGGIAIVALLWKAAL